MCVVLKSYLSPIINDYSFKINSLQMRDSSANQLLHQQDPDIVPSCSSTRNNQNQNLTHSNNQNPRSSETGGFEVEGDKTKFATLQRYHSCIT